MKKVIGFISIIMSVFLGSISFYEVREFLFGGPAIEISLQTNWILFFVGLVLIIFGALKFFKMK